MQQMTLELIAEGEQTLCLYFQVCLVISAWKTGCLVLYWRLICSSLIGLSFLPPVKPAGQQTTDNISGFHLGQTPLWRLSLGTFTLKYSSFVEQMQMLLWYIDSKRGSMDVTSMSKSRYMSLMLAQQGYWNWNFPLFSGKLSKNTSWNLALCNITPPH